MSNTVKPGTICEVIGGVLFPSPNLGKIVEVISFQGEHSEYGNIWRCKGHGKDLVSELGVVAIALDFAASWLRPLPDEELNKLFNVKKELKAA